MSSSRISLAPGSCLRLRRYPRAAVARHVAHTSITKRAPHQPIRACSSWRRNSPYWQDDRSKRQKTDDEVEKANKPDENQPKADSSHFEPSRREKMWQDRMDRIRRMVEHDPYEALFGYSNRLLKGMRRADWPIEAHNRWWQREMSFTVRNPFVGQKVEIETVESITKPEKEAANAESKTEPELEYDPISGRMVPKVGRATSEPIHSSTQPDQTHQNPGYPTEARSASQDRGVDIPIKPYRPSPQPPQPPQPRARVTPSFTLLKEDISQEGIPKADPEPISPARKEYEQFKTTRLPDTERSAKWLENEGFQDAKLDFSTTGSRSTLEERFDDLHSPTQEIAEDKLMDKRPWAPQRSKGTTIPTNSTFAAWRQKAKIPAYDEARADREIHEYTMQVAGDNLRNKRAVDETKIAEVEDKKPYKPLVHPALDVNAEKDIRDYATRVASDNLKTRRLAEQQKSRQQTDEQLAAMRRKQFDEFNAETKRLAEERAQKRQAKHGLQQVRSTLQDVKARLAEYETEAVKKPLNSLETSLQRHQDKSSVAQSLPLKTSLQRLNNTTSEVVLKPDQSLLSDTEQIRTHDPVGYNHNRESNRLQQLSSVKKPFKVPTLAEVFGYRKAKDRESNKTAEKNEIDPSAGWLLGEIESQKAAFNKFESSRKEPEVTAAKSVVEKPVADTKSSITQRVVKELEQKKQDTALVREIRQIYEDKYGSITTSHTQPLEDVSAPKVETSQIPEVPSRPTATSTTSEPIENIVAPSATEDSTSSSLHTEKEPSSTLATPIPSKTAKYTILAYDSKSKNMTTATFESIPTATETGIPATVALRHLAYANRFLPKLIELQHRGFVPVHAERNLLILRQDGGKGAPGGALEAGEEEVVQSERFVDIPGVHYPAQEGDAKEPKRLEPVFSGSSEKQREKAWRKWKEAQRQESQRRRRRFGRAVKFVGGGVVLSGAVVYLAGVGAEVRQNRGRGKVVVTNEDAGRRTRRD